MASPAPRSSPRSAAQLCVAALIAINCCADAAAADPPLRFNRDIRPIVSQKCFRCHGPDAAARQGELRLDQREDALAAGAIVPRDPARSELVRRVLDDGDAVMPPRDSGLTLSQREKEVLERWVLEGAEYERHWSLIRPVAPPVPSVKALHRPRNPIDRFVMASLERERLAPSREADAATLLRRASLVVTGLPPSPDELEAFLADRSPDAYENAVDRLLASPRFGERMATVWLDAARYADTNGYFGDNPRQIWPWRDWVISAFNRNQAFDEFTVEQIAGDLLPNSTIEQKVATGFLRNHMVTDETGVIDEEYRVEYVADRTETISTVWLGLTVGCARCHDHKYDPLPQRDYYRLFAFLNNGPETGLAAAHDPPPTLDLTTPAHRSELERLTAARNEADAALQRLTQSLREPIAAWEVKAKEELSVPTDRLTVRHGFEPEPGAPSKGLVDPVNTGSELKYESGVLGRAALLDGMQHIEFPHEALPDLDAPWTIGIWIKPTGSLNCILSKVQPTEARRGIEVLWTKGRLKVHLVHRWGAEAIEVATRDAITRTDWHHVVLRYDGSGKASGVEIFVDGTRASRKVERDSLKGPLSNTEPLRFGKRDSGLGYYGHFDEVRVVRAAVADSYVQKWHWSERLRGILAVPSEKRDVRTQNVLRDYYLQSHGADDARDVLRRAAQARREEESFRAALPKTLVMQDRPEPRATHILKRGQYDQPGDAVQAGFPAALGASPGSDVPRNRLDLARWIASPANPLTARVAVNRLWQIAFGEGLVRTVNDFGSQGEPPTHPELLDWLAVRFADSGWDVKQMLRLILTSATFRQSSAPAPALLAADPDNRLLARGPRFRLSGEMLRDQTLCVSGLLVERLGGPSVKPWQPPGLWEAVSYDGDASYVPDGDEGLWRRSVYSYWKRQSPPPALLIFDAPTRETCAVSRARTNTPSQALVMLNDEAFVEAARRLATAILAIDVPVPDAETDLPRLNTLFRRVTSRLPDQRESQVLQRLLDRERRHFAADPEAARKFASGSAPRRLTGETAGRAIELAAWTAVAQVLLNLDETLTSR